MVPQRNFLLHDLISGVFLRNLPFGIVVLGFLDAFVCAHHKHRLDSANAGNFGDYMSGRVRFMTAITLPMPTRTRPSVLGGVLQVLHTTHSVCPNPKPDIRFFLMFVPITRELGMTIVGGLLITDGGTRVVDGEIVAGWGVISRSPRGQIYIMFGPVVTTEAPLAFSGARIHSNNTAEMTAMIEAM